MIRKLNPFWVPAAAEDQEILNPSRLRDIQWVTHSNPLWLLLLLFGAFVGSSVATLFVPYALWQMGLFVVGIVVGLFCLILAGSLGFTFFVFFRSRRDDVLRQYFQNPDHFAVGKGELTGSRGKLIVTGRAKTLDGRNIGLRFPVTLRVLRQIKLPVKVCVLYRKENKWDAALIAIYRDY
ncbi:MAG: hypothetical protein JNL01_14750 [Bdellovibrionales bacterium]|nr:hypothetical protein [Bdellovibrionales bacterium]